MRFFKTRNFDMEKNNDISAIDEQNAWKWFRFKFYKQASLLFEKINNEKMKNL